MKSPKFIVSAIAVVAVVVIFKFILGGGEPINLGERKCLHNMHQIAAQWAKLIAGKTRLDEIANEVSTVETLSCPVVAKATSGNFSGSYIIVIAKMPRGKSVWEITRADDIIEIPLVFQSHSLQTGTRFGVVLGLSNQGQEGRIYSPLLLRGRTVSFGSLGAIEVDVPPEDDRFPYRDGIKKMLIYMTK